MKFAAISRKIADFSYQFFRENFDIAAVQKYANLVELEECCRTHTFLRNFVSIPPRTSPPKFCKQFGKIANLANLASVLLIAGLAAGRSRLASAGLACCPSPAAQSG